VQIVTAQPVITRLVKLLAGSALTIEMRKGAEKAPFLERRLSYLLFTVR
jgi:hypothetical protein